MDTRKPINTRKAISLATKYKMVKDIEKGDHSKKTIAAKYGISPSTLSMIIKKQDVIEQMYKANSASSYTNSRKRLRLSFYPDLEDSLYNWYLKSSVPMTRSVMIEKAMDIAKVLGYTNFKASYGFIERFKLRKGITFASNKSSKTTQHDADNDELFRDSVRSKSDPEVVVGQDIGNVKTERDDSTEFEIEISNQDQNVRNKDTQAVGKQVCSDHFVDGRPTEVNPVPTLYLGFDKTVEGRCFRKLRQGCISAPNMEQGDYPPGHLVSDYIPHIESKMDQSEKGYGVEYEETANDCAPLQQHQSSIDENWSYNQQYPNTEDTESDNRDDVVHYCYKDQGYPDDDRHFQESEGSYSDSVSGNEPVRKMKNSRFGQTYVTSNSYFRQHGSSEISRKRKRMTSLQQPRSGITRPKQSTASTVSIIPPAEIKVEQNEDWDEDNQEYSCERQSHFVEQSQHSLPTDHLDMMPFDRNNEYDPQKLQTSKSGTVVINLQDVNMSSLADDHQRSTEITKGQSCKRNSKCLESEQHGRNRKHSDRHYSGAVPVSIARVSSASPSKNLGTISDVNEGSFTVSSKCSCCDQMVEIKVTEFKKLLKLFIKPEFLDEICAF